MSMKKDKHITMREAKERTGLTSRQIRYYDEQNLIFPARSKGNQRLFSESDLQRLLKIKKLLADGNSIETIRLKMKTPQAKEIDPYAQLSEFEDSINDYADEELDSLYPVSNRFALLKKLTFNDHGTNDQEFEEEN